MSNLNNTNLAFMLGKRQKSQSTLAVNTDIKDILIELNILLLKDIFPLDIQTATLKKKVKQGKSFASVQINNLIKYPDHIEEMFVLLQTKLAPRKLGEIKWDSASILGVIEKEGIGSDSILEKLFQDNNSSQLYFNFLEKIKSNWHSLPVNQKVVFKIDDNKFSYQGIVSYLVSFAYYIRGISDVSSLLSFIQEHESGFKLIYEYLLVSASRRLIKAENLDLEDIDNDDNKFFASIKLQDVSFQLAYFSPQIISIVESYLNNGQYLELVDLWNTKHPNTKIKDELIPKIISLIRNFNNANTLQINVGSVEQLMPSIIMQAMKGGLWNDSQNNSTNYESTISDDDFTVKFIEDEISESEINKSNVKCAAQLFYSMTLGDELEVFNVVNYLTHKYLIRGGMEIRDRALRENLQRYVFSNKFLDANGREMEKTRPAERLMFYKQVFNYGNTTITDDVIVNTEFSKLWKIMILESAKYLERAQDSPNPMNFVSKQNVMQSVEDIQYNLSSHCTGMVNVITPIIYQELNFVIQKILNHEEIRRQVVPSGGSWWRVVENLYAAMRSRRMKTTAINNKAKTGHDVIRAIAEYNPSTFENDDNFSAFISDVDSFITTQSILQESLVDQIKQIDKNEKGSYEDSENNATQSKTPVVAGSDEWDF